MIDKSLIAPCSMNCALCQAYQGKGLTCKGCGSESARKSCQQCSIRLCKEKKYFCFECKQYPCKRLKRLDQRYRERYHMSMLGNLKIIKETGLESFLLQQEKSYRCKRCGKLKTVHQSDCLYCSFQSSTSKREDDGKSKKICHLLLREYQSLIRDTSIIKSYQTVLQLIKGLHASLIKKMPDFHFQKQVVENGMEYSYFQLTNSVLKENGLKITVVFVHTDCRFEIWLSGYNRIHQQNYHQVLQNSNCPYELSKDPKKEDYIFKICLNDSLDSLVEEELHLHAVKTIECINLYIAGYLDKKRGEGGEGKDYACKNSI